MAEQQNGAQSGRAIPPKMLALKASQNDDPALIAQALSVAGQPTSRDTPQELLDRTLRQSIRRGSNKVLDYVLEHGAKPPTSSSVMFEEDGPPSKETFEILLKHGWDINSREWGGKPFLWNVAHVPNLVRWALDHGASTTPQQPAGSDPSPDRQEDCPALLEYAVKLRADVDTFELLRSHGAQLGKRTLHFAAEQACYQHSLDMVRHLVDTVKLDANALDAPQGTAYGNHYGTPLCYVAQAGPVECREVVRFLLDNGADPHLKIEAAGWDAVSLAEKRRNQVLVDLVREREQGKA